MKPTTTHSTASRLVGLASAIALATPLWAAQPVTIANAGFEDPVLTDGSVQSGVPDWSAFNGGNIAVLNPASASDLTAEAPEGANVGLVTSTTSEDGLSQALASTFVADADYTLTVKVANTKFTAGFPGYRVQLLANGTVLAEDDNSQAVAEDAVITSTVNYTYDAGDAGLAGQPLGIRLLSKGLNSGQEVAFDDVQLTVTLGSPVASPGSYTIFVSDSLSLDGSNSMPSDGATITTWEWDLDNDGIFDDATGATPATIDYATLTGTYGMSLGLNAIKLKVTDSAAKSSTAEGIVEIKSPVLVDEDWQDPLNSNGLRVDLNPVFSGWNIVGETYSIRKDNTGWLPGDSTVSYPNQAINPNQTSSYADYDIVHNWAATDVYHLRIEASPNSWGGANQRWIRPELRQQDGTVLWSAPQDSTTALPLYSSYMGGLTDYTSELTFFFQIDASTFTAGAAGQPIRLRLAHSGQRSVAFNNVTLVLGPLPVDTTPPTPDPLTWDVLPTVSNFKDINMRVNSARDPDDLYGVEYYFENVTRATNSGWQDSREWAETDLDYNTSYTYRVKARDKSPNQNESTTWSASESATTEPQDLTAPSPDPLTWDTLPMVADYRSITMSVNAATDPSGVEYYFENVTKGTNSGWIAARAWTEKELDPDTSYTYRAKARDTSLDQNESTTWSTQESATTPTEPAGTLLITRFQDPLIPTNTALSPGLLGNWTFFGGKVQQGTADGRRTDTDLSTPSNNQMIQFEWANQWIEYDIPHNWSSTDTFTLTLNASPQAWSGESQRYVRPEIRQQDGTVLWAPGENMSGPEKTAVPLYSTLVGSSYQDDPNTSFSYTIPASAFTAGTEGQPIRIRIGQSGARGLYIDNVHLSLGGTAPSTPYDTWATGGELFDGDSNGDGVSNGLAFLLGASGPNVDALGLLPTPTEDGSGGLVMTFSMLDSASRGTAALSVEHSSDLGIGDPWTTVAVPDASGGPTSGVTFVVSGSGTLAVTATIASSEAAAGKLFGRLKATE